ncbi:MAG: hypothetical protein AB7H96_03760 [Vicinamibacterales bacterium]
MTHPFEFHGLVRRVEQNGVMRLVPHHPRPAAIPCPTTGRALKIAAIDASAPALCPSCMQTGHGAFVSFVSDLRMAYACPQCDQLIWAAGS